MSARLDKLGRPNGSIGRVIPWHAEAKQLVQSGMSQRAAAIALNVSKSSLRWAIQSEEEREIQCAIRRARKAGEELPETEQRQTWDNFWDRAKVDCDHHLDDLFKHSNYLIELIIPNERVSHFSRGLTERSYTGSYGAMCAERGE